jgi:hypothetical protein
LVTENCYGNAYSQFRALMIVRTKLYILYSINYSKLQIQISFKPLLRGLQTDGIHNRFHMELMHFIKLDPRCFIFTFIVAFLTIRTFLFYTAHVKPSFMFACFDACLDALIEVKKFSIMTLDDKIVDFTSATAIRKLLELLIIWVRKR